MSDSKSLSQQRFTQHAEGYINSKTHATGHDLDRLVELASPQPAWTALDVATGGGHTARRLSPCVRAVVACDITFRMLHKAREYLDDQGLANITFAAADAEKLPFSFSAFDLVTCRIAAHHFPHPGRFVHEAARVLKSGGRLVVQDIILPEDDHAARLIDQFERLRDPSHARAFSQHEWTVMFAEAGFTIDGVEMVTKRHAFLDWANRQGCSPATIRALVETVNQASPVIKDWLQPEDWNTPEASFVNHHFIIAGII